jgi:hypothetical protein
MPCGVVSGEKMLGCFPCADCFIIYSCSAPVCACKQIIRTQLGLMCLHAASITTLIDIAINIKIKLLGNAGFI